MITKLRATLAGVAVIFLAGGVNIYQAYTTAGANAGLTIDEQCLLAPIYNDEQLHGTFYIAIPQTIVTEGLPQAWPDDPDGRVLGSCNAEVCQFGRSANHACNFYYSYKGGPLVNGYRLFEVTAHPFIAGGWRAWAQSTSGEAFGTRVYWWESFVGPLKGCINSPNMTDVQCLNLLDLDSRCLVLPDGRLCRYGLLVGETGNCPYATILPVPESAALFPCIVDAGDDPIVEAWRDWELEAEQFDNL